MLVWRFFGIWPETNDGYLYIVIAIIAHALFSFTFTVCMLLSIGTAANAVEIADILLIAATFICTSTKAVILIVNRKVFLKALELFKELEIGTDTCPEEQDILLKASKSASRVWLMYSALGYTAVSSAVIGPFINGHVLVYPSVYPFDWESSRTCYYLTLTYQAISNYFILIIMLTIDTYGPVMFLFLSTYLNILRLRLETAGSIMPPLSNVPDAQVNLEHYRATVLGQCGNYHQLCLKYE